MSEPTPFIQPIPPPLRRCEQCHLFFPTPGELLPTELRAPWSCDDCDVPVADVGAEAGSTVDP